MAQFPAPEWITALTDKLNTDEHYAHVARNWEGDMLVKVEPGGSLEGSILYYLDLWHGKCRDAYQVIDAFTIKPTLTLSAPYQNYIKILSGDLDAMQALMTRKISVQGNFGLLMRNVPTVLDFVRCCREITDSFA
jgi:putative sterol carrier protein